MSRSRRKFPRTAWTTSDSEKQDKRWNHRRMRARTRHAIHHDPEGLMPTEREISDPWNMDKDGKQWIDPEKWPEAMRK